MATDPHVYLAPASSDFWNQFAADSAMQIEDQRFIEHTLGEPTLPYLDLYKQNPARQMRGQFGDA